MSAPGDILCALALGAVLALLAVAWHLRHIERDRKAALLADLHAQFEAPPSRTARLLLKRLHDAARAELAEKGTPEDVAVRVTVRLNQLYAERPADYADLAQLAGFFDMLGHLTRRRYVSFRDVAGLYGDAILFVDAVFRPHLEWRRQRESQEAPTLYDSAVALCRRTRRFYERRRRRREILATVAGRDR